MDEFEIFKARATGCEINAEHLEASESHQRRRSTHGNWRSDTLNECHGKESRRKSLRRSERKKHEVEKEGCLQVKVEIQPPSPITCRRDLRRESDVNNSPKDETCAERIQVFDFDRTSASQLEETSEANNLKFKNVEHTETATSNGNLRKKNRHSFTGAHRGESLLPSEEFVCQPSREDEEQKIFRSRSCRNSSSFKQSHSARKPHDSSNSAVTQIPQVQQMSEDEEDEETEHMKVPTVYRVRSFTTKKGEIVSRGDSFKICNSSANQNFLCVGEPGIAGQRRCSVAVQGGSYSRLEMCTLTTPGNNSVRRSSFTCLASNQLDVAPPVRRGSSEHRRVSTGRIENFVENQRKSSLSSVRKNSLDPSDRDLLTTGNDRWSNKSAEEIFEEEMHCFGSGEAPPPQVYHVSVLGYPGVGKSTLINQLMTSEYLANKEQNDQGDDDEERVVSVALDDIESTVHFHDGNPQNADASASANSDMDAYMLIFSVTERNSFSYIQTCLHDLLKNDKRFHHSSTLHSKPPQSRLSLRRYKSPPPPPPQQPPTSSPDDATGTESVQLNSPEVRPIKPVLYLVANKQDQVRNRNVSEAEVKRLSEIKRNKCKYAEVSALLDHKVDEVLVDIVREIRRRAIETEEDSDVEDTSSRGCLEQAVVGFCAKLFK